MQNCKKNLVLLWDFQNSNRTWFNRAFIVPVIYKFGYVMRVDRELQKKIWGSSSTVQWVYRGWRLWRLSWCTVGLETRNLPSIWSFSITGDGARLNLIENDISSGNLETSLKQIRSQKFLLLHVIFWHSKLRNLCTNPPNMLSAVTISAAKCKLHLNFIQFLLNRAKDSIGEHSFIHLLW